MKKGYIQIYTGNGKGKTTAAIGLAVRAAGAGMKVLIVQFLKGVDTSELNILNKIDNIEIMRDAETKKFSWQLDWMENIETKLHVKILFVKALKHMESENYDVVIFDELLGAFHGEYITKTEIINMLKEKPDTCEYVLTGRAAPRWLVNRADLVSSIEAKKHYMDTGVMGRKGIEF